MSITEPPAGRGRVKSHTTCGNALQTLHWWELLPQGSTFIMVIPLRFPVILFAISKIKSWYGYWKTQFWELWTSAVTLNLLSKNKNKKLFPPHYAAELHEIHWGLHLVNFLLIGFAWKGSWCKAPLQTHGQDNHNKTQAQPALTKQQLILGDYCWPWCSAGHPPHVDSDYPTSQLWSTPRSPASSAPRQGCGCLDPAVGLG